MNIESVRDLNNKRRVVLEPTTSPPNSLSHPTPNTSVPNNTPTQSLPKQHTRTPTHKTHKHLPKPTWYRMHKLPPRHTSHTNHTLTRTPTSKNLRTKTDLLEDSPIQKSQNPCATNTRENKPKHKAHLHKHVVISYTELTRQTSILSKGLTFIPTPHPPNLPPSP